MNKGSINKWQRIIGFFNSKRAGKLFTRSELLRFVTDLNHRAYLAQQTLTLLSAENYRLILTRAGYLEHEEDGVYRKVRKIPGDLSYTAAVARAYPNRAKRKARLTF